VRNLIFWLAEDSLSLRGAAKEQIEAFAEDGYLGLRCFKFKQLVNPRVLSDDELASFEVPVLFLVGENERIYSAAAAVERLRRVAPAIEIEVVSGAGHDLTLARADVVNERVARFLAELESAPEGELGEKVRDEPPLVGEALLVGGALGEEGGVE
jgi:pimeloyl-ACP methyl ester carboxylesterase